MGSNFDYVYKKLAISKTEGSVHRDGAGAVYPNAGSIAQPYIDKYSYIHIYIYVYDIYIYIYVYIYWLGGPPGGRCASRGAGKISATPVKVDLGLFATHATQFMCMYVLIHVYVYIYICGCVSY